ncbi:OmpA family protein [Psychroflexus salis]|uniref:OmpA family protein n=1 Tax=Psychroflexus salis TaxID=1526574 RepID=UPI00166575DA|nr:OmpA family protein [Psychroflexus salis]
MYFANNSVELENKYTSIIENLVVQLNEEPKIDVSITGFASKTGNEAYNLQLYMQRA